MIVLWRILAFSTALGWWVITSSPAAAADQPTAPIREAGAVRPAAAEVPVDAETPPQEQAQANEPQPEVPHHAEAHAAAEQHADDAHAGGHDDHGPKLGTLIPKWSVLPFAILLGCVAVFPLVNPHWWEHNTNKGIIVALLAVPTVAYLWSLGAPGIHGLEHAIKEYISFVVLLGALFIISGGVYVRGSLKGAPALNTAILAIGTAIASVVGTTGASMLLIRPLLRANQYRDRVAHIVIFFIFTVSNCGGLLTPLGDPPLFLGFLKGVPFEWTLRLWPQWLMANGILLAAFFVWDSIVYAKEAPKQGEAAAEAKEPFGIEGAHNFAFLGAIVAIIYCAGQNIGGFGAAGEPWPFGYQETLMALVALAAFVTTPGKLREKNRFSFGPIIEVAVLFIGIFCTMIPALAILNVEGKSLGVTTPWQFFWVTGALSSFLDNAPTYVAFAVTAAGTFDVPDQGRFLQVFLHEKGELAAQIIAAISCGAVFMGANTYIGNGPNFMVKAIAEENNVKMPTFFGYMAYSVGILIPIFVVMTFVFFRHA